MELERLYKAIDLALTRNGLNLYGAWDRMSYSAKTLNCQRLIESEDWRNLPPVILEYANVDVHSEELIAA